MISAALFQIPAAEVPVPGEEIQRGAGLRRGNIPQEIREIGGVSRLPAAVDKLAEDIAGGVAALVLLLTKKIKRKQFLAYGPYFALSAIGLILKLLHTLF